MNALDLFDAHEAAQARCAESFEAVLRNRDLTGTAVEAYLAAKAEVSDTRRALVERLLTVDGAA